MNKHTGRLLCLRGVFPVRNPQCSLDALHALGTCNKCRCLTERHRPASPGHVRCASLGLSSHVLREHAALHCEGISGCDCCCKAAYLDDDVAGLASLLREVLTRIRGQVRQVASLWQHLPVRTKHTSHCMIHVHLQPYTHTYIRYRTNAHFHAPGSQG